MEQQTPEKQASVPATDARAQADATARAIAESPRKTLYKALNDSANLSEWKKAAPAGFDVNRLGRIIYTECNKNPLLTQCSLQSVMSCAIQSATLGLEPGSALGHAYLIPYWNKKLNGYECQMQIGYKGMIDLARRSGQIISITAHVVYEKDDFEIEYGDDERIRHRPCLTGEPGKPSYVYASAKLKGGGTQRALMTVAEVEAIRKRANANRKGSTPWDTDWAEMAKKTAVRRLFKMLPVSIEAAEAVRANERIEENSDFVEGEGEFVDDDGVIHQQDEE